MVGKLAGFKVVVKIEIVAVLSCMQPTPPALMKRRKIY
jgi:hypothetical protein